MLLKTKLITHDPLAVFQLLALSPALIAATTLSRALAVGAALALSRAFSSLSVSLLRGTTPAKLRTPTCLLVHSVWVTLILLLMRTLLPTTVSALGVYLPILAVNCMAMLRLEVSAAQNSPGAAISDGILHGVEFLIFMLACGFIRELFGMGRLFATPSESGGILVFPAAPLAFLRTPAGALLLVGLFAAILQGMNLRMAAKEENAPKETV